MRYVRERKVAGGVAAVSHRNGELYYPAAGTIALDSQTPFDENSICRIYSMSKPVTGIAAMMLVESGAMQLDQPAADVLPEFRSLRVLVDPKKGLDSLPARNTMTMRHLLTHTSGLDYWTPLSPGPLSALYRERGITPGNVGARLNRPGYGPQVTSLDEMVGRVAELPLAHEPGTVYRYSLGLDVMGLVIERVSGRPLPEFLRERLFGPLEMTSTGFQIRAEDIDRVTTNYNVTPKGLVAGDTGRASIWLQPPQLVAGGGGLVSTARDFARLGAMLLGDGALGRVRVMKPETARLSRSNLLPPGILTPHGNGWGAGAGVVLAKDGSSHDSPGTFSAAGAAGTVWWIDPARGVNGTVMMQFMPPDSYPLLDDTRAAIEADIRSGQV